MSYTVRVLISIISGAAYLFLVVGILKIDGLLNPVVSVIIAIITFLLLSKKLGSREKGINTKSSLAIIFIILGIFASIVISFALLIGIGLSGRSMGIVEISITFGPLLMMVLITTAYLKKR